MNKKTILPVFIATGIVLFLAANIYFFQQATQHPILPIYGYVNDFRLTDAGGKDLQLADLRNKVWVANFFFTTCSDICPMMTKNMAALHRSYKLLDDVAFVSITVNPENDTTAALAQYSKKYQADNAKWHFLTGSREAITQLMVGSFKLQNKEDPIFHSSLFVLVDRKGQIRGYYEGAETKGIQKLFTDIASLIKEKRL